MLNIGEMGGKVLKGGMYVESVGGPSQSRLPPYMCFPLPGVSDGCEKQTTNPGRFADYVIAKRITFPP